MTHDHSKCEYYVPQDDGCLCYYMLGAFNVSQYDKCYEDIIYEEED